MKPLGRKHAAMEEVTLALRISLYAEGYEIEISEASVPLILGRVDNLEGPGFEGLAQATESMLGSRVRKALRTMAGELRR